MCCVLQILQRVVGLVSIQMVHLPCLLMPRRSMKSKLDQTMHEITLPFQPNTFIASWLLISMTNCAAQVAEAPKIADLPTVT